MAKRTKPELQEKARAHLRAKVLGQKHYKRADRLLEELLPELKKGAEIPLPGGKKAKLKDNFSTTNRVYRTHGIARYELEIIES
jgi:hypothetical protein